MSNLGQTLARFVLQNSFFFGDRDRGGVSKSKFESEQMSEFFLNEKSAEI